VVFWNHPLTRIFKCGCHQISSVNLSRHIREYSDYTFVETYTKFGSDKRSAFR
jgi:hypothetical protein